MRSIQSRFKIRKKRVRNHIKQVSGNRLRLTVFKSNRHIYAQIINDINGVTLASASSLDAEIKKSKYYLNKLDAKKVGELLASRAIAKGIDKVVFDKGGYVYHGIIQSLAEGARVNLSF